MGQERGAMGLKGYGEAAFTAVDEWVLQQLEADDELAWQADARCAQTDPEAFFPVKGGSAKEAKKVCGSCEVRMQCLQFAIENDERFGIWGGLSERERRKLRKRMGNNVGRGAITGTVELSA